MQIALVSVVGLLCALAVAAYAIDRAHNGKISEGIRIGGVDVGGMTEKQAERRLHSRLVAPLDKPVTVTYEKTKYVLSPEKLQVRADIQGMVDAALRASRSGDFPSRVWRYATGGTVDREIAPHIAYSADALDQFLAKVEQEVNRPAQDASISPTPTSLNTVPAQDGVALDTGQLRSELRAAIESPHNRVIKAPAERVQPEVTTDELAQEYPVYLTVDRSGFQLSLWENLKLTKTYTIAVGAVGFDTPAGVYSIDSKQVDPTWYVPDAAWAGDLAGTTVPPGPDNPLQARWMGFYDGAGIHGTNDVASLGTAASHGCLRMAVPDVIELYDQVPLGTPIYIG